MWQNTVFMIIDKSCFLEGMAFGKFMDLPWRTAYDKVLPHKAFIVAKNLEYGGYQCVFVSMFYRSFW